MVKLAILLLALVATLTSAFAPVATTPAARVAAPLAFSTKQSSVVPTTTALSMAEDMFWEGEYPPSKVLGPILSKMPSGLLGILSGLSLAACVISVSQSAVLQQEVGAMANGSWIKWYYILGSFGGPMAWGLHVACWIQRQNGK